MPNWIPQSDADWWGQALGGPGVIEDVKAVFRAKQAGARAKVPASLVDYVDERVGTATRLSTMRAELAERGVPAASIEAAMAYARTRGIHD